MNETIKSVLSQDCFVYEDLWKMVLSIDDRIFELSQKWKRVVNRDEAHQEGRLAAFYTFLDYVTCLEEERGDLEELLSDKNLLAQMRKRMRQRKQRSGERSLEVWCEQVADDDSPVESDKAVHVPRRDERSDCDFWVFEFYERLRQWLGEGEDYETVCMRLQGFTQREIAAFYNITPPAQCKRMEKIREKLDGFLAEGEDLNMVWLWITNRRWSKYDEVRFPPRKEGDKPKADAKDAAKGKAEACPAAAAHEEEEEDDGE